MGQVGAEVVGVTVTVTRVARAWGPSFLLRHHKIDVQEKERRERGMCGLVEEMGPATSHKIFPFPLSHKNPPLLLKLPNCHFLNKSLSVN
ncbi:uncharacterized protein G2W53_036774 [Senna tora]|uniref:Uncharacterized protein n=1 Tax=Senna tora TaxID=362788 RepID=A0A834SVY6_9FABA|nr:uncharacterized protein G2W53_036774 [Senna tora]